jgi:selenocysteine-specific elongation factor
LVEVLNFLVLQGELVKVTEGHYMAAPALEDLKEQLVAFLRTHGELSPADFKELTGLSRKWAIPLLELLDKTQFTMRVGEVRKLRASL